MQLKNFKISTRLVAGFGLMAALMAVLSIQFLGNIRSVQTEFRDMTQDHYPKVVAIHTVKSLVL
jgi:hypothetical protein